jgi:hypothetical protein
LRKPVPPAIRSAGWNGQSLGSLQRRPRGCIFGVRSQPYEFGAPELIALELHLMTGAAGMAMESPVVPPQARRRGRCHLPA